MVCAVTRPVVLERTIARPAAEHWGRLPMGHAVRLGLGGRAEARLVVTWKRNAREALYPAQQIHYFRTEPYAKNVPVLARDKAHVCRVSAY